MARPRKPDPEVFEGDYRIPAAVGSLGWAIALVVLIVLRDSIAPEDRWWIWVCAVGLLLGLVAFIYIPHMHRRRAAAAERREEEPDLDTVPNSASEPPGRAPGPPAPP